MTAERDIVDWLGAASASIYAAVEVSAADDISAGMKRAKSEISTLRAQVEALREALASVENQAEIADDPEHHTLSLVKYIARAALAQEGKVES